MPINRHVSIQPDLQYVIHPGEVNQNALVVILRVNIHFS
ncbi:carbohydrate porin [Acidithiobacillus sp. MC6.1]|nr:carbohydrate porin [Acidithiobacillus sp. MC6.1]